MAAFLDISGGAAEAEDQELALRHSACGGRIVFIPEADTVHYDHSLELQSYCRRVEWGSANVLPFCYAWPDWPQNIERQRINGPLQITQEPLGISLRKIVKSILAQPIMLKGLFQLAFWLEKTMPHSTALDRYYRFLLGIHLQKGYRKGLKKYSEQDKLQTQSPKLNQPTQPWYGTESHKRQDNVVKSRSLKIISSENKQLIVFATENLLHLAKKPKLKTKDLRLNLALMVQRAVAT